MRNNLYITMLKIGLIGFGGGNALVPVMEQEIVKNEQAISKEDFNKDVVVANITPGALTSKVVTGVGMQADGIKGMLLYPVLMALPGAFLTVLLLAIMTGLTEQVLSSIEYLALGVTSFVVYILGQYVSNTLKGVTGKRDRMISAGIVALVFLLSCGKELYGIFGIARTPIFDISALNILLTALFVIAYLNDSIAKKKIVVSSVMVGAYMLTIGKTAVLPFPFLKTLLPVIMMLLVARELRLEWQRHGTKQKFELKGLWRELLVWILFIAILSVPAWLLVPGASEFLANGLFSSYISFGGGDAYLSVAEGLFVQGGYISEADFFNRVVPVINTLPGSILCKALVGIGFCYGYAAGQNMVAGLAMALAGFACSVAASSTAFCAVLYLYESLEGFSLFQMIKKWIRPVMAGLLLSVATGIFQGNLKMGESHGFATEWVVLLTIGIVAMNALVGEKTKKSGLFLVIPSAMISFLVCACVLV